MKKDMLFILLAFTLIMLFPGSLTAGEIRVAVASNFTNVIKTIAERFEANTGHKVTLMIGSTGKHYAQIKNGAPFDVFFAADIHRPQLLEEAGIAIPGSRFTYAVGKVVLWSPMAGYVDTEGKILKYGEFHRLAIANPKLAPYGAAAQEILHGLGVWDRLRGRIVQGENISQTLQFIRSGSAELGFVAYSQVKRAGHSIEGSWWEVPQSLYTPIRQQAVLLKEDKAARAFLDFVRSDVAREIIHGYGYGTP